MNTILLENFKKSFDGDFFFDDIHRLIYATDASVYRKIPLAVAYPKSTEAIIQLVNFVNTHEISLIPRAAGTSLAGQVIGDGIIVDMSKYFTRILHLDLKKQTVTVQPGVIRDELNQFLKPHGLFFGPNTSTSNRCMIGGMVGNNSSGTTSIRYGVTRDKVLQLKTVLSSAEEVVFENLTKDEFHQKTKLSSLEGEIYRLIHHELSSSDIRNEIRNEFPKREIHRRNTGYAVDKLLDNNVFSEQNSDFNFCKLLCGSEGTLAITTEITLQLDPLPPEYTVMIASHYKSLEDCLNDVVIAMQHNLYTCEMMDDVILDCTKNNKIYESYRDFVNGNPKAILLLELKDSTAEGLQSQIKSLLESLKLSEYSYHNAVLKGKKIWEALELRKAGLGLLGNMIGDKKAVACIEDTAVALEDLPAYIMEFSELMKKYNQHAVYYAHAGAGELHLRPILNLKKQADVDYFRKITTDVAHLCKKYKGSFSGEHGDGIVRAEFIPILIGDKNYQLLRRIKSVFDPDNIFNPGKIVDSFKMDESLRYLPDRDEPEIETFLDFSDYRGILRLAENCNGSGDCRKTEQAAGTMCPSYHATRNEKDTTRARANMLREVLTNNQSANKFNSRELKEVFDLCISCKACASECPSNVDIGTAKAEFLYQYYIENKPSFSTKLFALSSHYNKKAARFPRITNFLFSNAMTSFIIKKVGGIHQKRTMPKISVESFETQFRKLNLEKLENPIRRIFLFIDEFCNYLDTHIATDALFLLNKLNYEVIPVYHLDSGRAMISKGFLKEAKIEVDKNISFFTTIISDETPLVGLEPSAILSFRDEYLRLATDKESAMKIARNTFLIEEFIASEMQAGNIRKDQFTSEEKQIKIHIHCHHKSLGNQKDVFDILNFPVNFKPIIIPAGCCGMAGSFGYEKDHYDVSMKIGELKLFPSIRKSSEETVIVSSGTSCRHQIQDGTGRGAIHPVSLLQQSLVS